MRVDHVRQDKVLRTFKGMPLALINMVLQSRYVLDSASIRRIGFVFLLTTGLLLLLPGLGESVMNREQELRVALTARNMAEGGSWVFPQYLGEPRLQKPPLMYWLVATAYTLTGTVTSAFVARIPSALSGVALMLVVYVLGGRLIGRRRAFIASFVLATSFLFLRQGRSAETDITLTLFTTTAVLSGFLAARSKQSTGWWVMAGISAGLGFITKGPAAIGIPLLSWIAALWVDPSTRSRTQFRSMIPGALLCILISAPWYIAVFLHGQHDPIVEAQLAKELTRTFTHSKHTGPVWYYLYAMPHAMLPWCLWLPATLWHIPPVMKRRTGLRLIVAWLFIAFVCLSVISSKQIHYATLLLPPAALLVGWFLGRRSPAHQPDFWLSQSLTFGAIALAIGAVAVMTARVTLPDVPQLPVALGAASILFACLLGSSPLRPLHSRMATLILAMSLMIHTVTTHLQGFFEKDLPVAFVALAATSLTPEGASAFHVGENRSILEFYSGKSMNVYPSLQSAWTAARHGDIIFASGRIKNRPPESSWPSSPVLDRAMGEIYCQAFLKKD